MASPIAADAFPSLLESSYRKAERTPPPKRQTPPPQAQKAPEEPKPTASGNADGRYGPPSRDPKPARLGDFLSNKQTWFLNNQPKANNDTRKQPRPPPSAAVLVPRLDVNVKRPVNLKATEKLFYQTPTDESNPPRKKPNPKPKTGQGKTDRPQNGQQSGRRQNNGNNRNEPRVPGTSQGDVKFNGTDESKTPVIANGEAKGTSAPSESPESTRSQKGNPRNQKRGKTVENNRSSEEAPKQQSSQRAEDEESAGPPTTA